MQNALKLISEEFRQPLVLKEIDGFSYEEIAQIAGVPVGTVKSRLYHAFTNLRKSIYAPETTATQEVN